MLEDCCIFSVKRGNETYPIVPAGRQTVKDHILVQQGQKINIRGSSLSDNNFKSIMNVEGTKINTEKIIKVFSKNETFWIVGGSLIQNNKFPGRNKLYEEKNIQSRWIRTCGQENPDRNNFDIMGNAALWQKKYLRGDLFMKPTPELRQAVAEYRAGRQEAFTALYEGSSRYVYVCIREVVGKNDNAEDIISDIMQDTYVEISRSIGQLRDEDAFLTWAGKIAANKCYRWMMKNKREVLLNENDTTFENLADTDNIIPEEILQSLEKQRLVRQIIDTQLTEMQKLCIVAYYYNEQKQSEIAWELGIPENTVKTNLSRAKAKIKEGVLDIEKKQGTKLYSIAPLLLFLFNEEASACTVPKSITIKVNAAVSAAKGIVKKTLWGKPASASIKIKVVSGIVASAAAISAGTAVYMMTQDKGETWEQEFREILLADKDAAGFDLNDFEEDGIPELVILNEDGSLTLCSYREGEEPYITHLKAGAERGDERHHILEQNDYGYDLDYGRLIELKDVALGINGNEADHLIVPTYILYQNGNTEKGEYASYGYTNDVYPADWVYTWSSGGKHGFEISEAEAVEHIAEAQSRFNEIIYTDITEEDIEERFNEFEENGNRGRKRSSTVAKPVQTGGETVETIETQEAPVKTEITLSDKERKDLQVLVGILTLNCYHRSENMYGYHYPVNDLAVDMTTIDILGNQGLTDDVYMKYLPPTEKDDALIRYCNVDDVQLYLKNVFGIENADISAYCEGNRVVFNMIGDFALTDSFIDDVATMSDGAYKIEGEFVLWIATGIPEAVYPYELTVIKNDASPFGFQVISMEYQEEVTEDYGRTKQTVAGGGSLRGILLNPDGNKAYYPQGVEYGNLYFALIDIDKDGEDEILLGTPGTTDYFGVPIWITIFNILKYDRNSGKVTDFDGDKVYAPLDTDSWHYYDTGILMTRAGAGQGHTNFWNLLTGEFTDAALWVPDDPDKGPESEGHSRIYNVNGSDMTGAEADQYYQSLTSGNEIPIIWCEVNPTNIEALINGGSAAAVNIPAPLGSYKSNRGSEMEFYSDNTVRITEGSIGHVYNYTIDSMGNVIIDPENEALEGTYNSAADELVFYEMKYKKR